MSRLPILPLHVGAALLGAVGLVFLLIPPTPPDPGSLPALPPVPAVNPDVSEDAQALLTFEEIARRNVLSADRSPPAERYAPQGTPPARPAPRPAAPRLRLYGLASGPSGAVALIDADPSIPGAEIYRPGDRVGTYRLESIADTFVVMSDSSGSRILRLEPPERRTP